MVSRRKFVGGLAAASAWCAAPLPRVTGVQLYAVRAGLKTNPDATLKALAGIGFKEVEGYNRPASVALAPKLKEYGLTLRSCQVEAPLMTANWELFPDLKQISLQEAIDSVASAGAEYFTMGYISPGARGDGEDFFRRTGDRMNAAAEQCRKAGLKFAFQTHAFEFAGRPGLRPIDLYRERLDPKLVGMELDVFWMSVARQDFLRIFKDWKGHVPLLRLADKARGAPYQFDETIANGAFAEMGEGDIDFPAILKAAAAAGAKDYFVGQDETEGDPIESLRKAYAKLN